MSKPTKAELAEREDAKAKLREWLKPGDTVYTILRHVSRSGMRRTIGVVIMVCGEPLWPDWLVATALGMRADRDREGIVVDGCGMDMGFHIVYELGHALWPDGFGCVGKGCRANDHSNGDRSNLTHEESLSTAGESGYGEPHWHNSGGYALRHRWL